MEWKILLALFFKSKSFISIFSEHLQDFQNLYRISFVSSKMFLFIYPCILILHHQTFLFNLIQFPSIVSLLHSTSYNVSHTKVFWTIFFKNITFSWFKIQNQSFFAKYFNLKLKIMAKTKISHTRKNTEFNKRPPKTKEYRK